MAESKQKQKNQSRRGEPIKDRPKQELDTADSVPAKDTGGPPTSQSIRQKSPDQKAKPHKKN